MHFAAGEALSACRAQSGWAVGAQDNVAAPQRDLQREPAALVVASAVDRQRLVANFPAIAIRAMENTDAVKLLEARYLWKRVDHPGREKELPREEALAFAGLHRKDFFLANRVGNARFDHCYGMVGRKLRSADAAKLGRRNPVAREKSMKRTRSRIARFAVVEEQYRPAASAQNQGSIEARGPPPTMITSDT